MTTLEPDNIVPERMITVAKPSRRDRIRVALTDGMAALLLNAAVLVFIARFALPTSTLPPAPESISVELVNSIPNTPQVAPSTRPKTEQSQAGTGGSGTGPGSIGSPPPSPTPTIEASSLQPQGATVAKEAPPPEKEPPADPEPPAETQPAAAIEPAKPPPVDRQSATEEPHLVEAPPDPRRSATQAEQNVVANDATDKPEKPKHSEPPPPAPAPEVLTSEDASTAVPEPSRKPDLEAQKPEPTEEEKRQAENTAKLAAALPYSTSFMPDSLRTSLSGSGSTGSREYRGAVYGAFRKADDIVEQARAKNLHGQTVVAFTVDNKGEIASIKVAVSSGNREVDETALDIIRRSAPFPPPPPGAPRSFSPAIGLGLDGG